MESSNGAAIVTGAARGIGFAIAKAFVEAGVAVALVDILEEDLAQAAKTLEELGGRTSLFNPLWALGSLGIGLLAGVAGDNKSLGFIEETEIQVCAHLDKHLDELPQHDSRSRKIIRQMREDEARHARTAHAMGATRLSGLSKTIMKIQAKVMTSVAYRL